MMEMLQSSKPKSNKGPVFLPGIETYLKQIGQELPDPQGEKLLISSGITVFGTSEY